MNLKRVMAWVLTVINLPIGVISYAALHALASFGASLVWWADLALAAGGPLAALGVFSGIRRPRQLIVVIVNSLLVAGYLIYFWIPTLLP